MSISRSRRPLAALLLSASVVALALLGATPATAVAGGPPTPVPGAPASSSGFTEFNGKLYLGGVAEGDVYSRLHSFDGTTFTQIPGSPVGPADMIVLGDELVFEAIVDINALPSYAFGLFTYDGTTITQVTGAFETPNDFVLVGNAVYFQATVAGAVQLWQYDGTTASAVPGGDVDPSQLSAYNGKVYFAGDSDPTPAESITLFSYDPATPATPAAPIAGAPADPRQLVAYNGLAYFGADGTLWAFDGASTFTPVPIAPAEFPGALTVFDGALYFVASEGGGFGNVSSFRDGVTTKIPGAVTETASLVVYNGKLCYLGFANGEPLMNVISGGQVSVLPGSPEYTFNLVVFQGKLYFTGDTADLSNVMFVYESALAATGSAFETGMPLLAALALLLGGAALAVGGRARARRT